jgi:hypothetical protein
MGETPIIEPPLLKWPVAVTQLAKSPLKGAPLQLNAGAGLTQPSSDLTPEERPCCSIPHQSWCRIIRLNPNKGQSKLQQQKGPRLAGLPENWYREGDSNPYSLWPLPPQGSVSTLLHTACCVLLLLRSLRYVRRFSSRLSCIKNRYIFNSRLSLLHFKDCRIRQTNLSHAVSFVFSKER